LWDAADQQAQAAPSDSAHAPHSDPTPHLYGASVLGITGTALAAGAIGIGAQCDPTRTGCVPANAARPQIGALSFAGAGLVLGATGWFLGALAEDATPWWIVGGLTAAASVGLAVAIGVAHASQGCTERNADGSCRSFSE